MRECLPVVHMGRQRITELARNASNPKVVGELDALAGQRLPFPKRDALMSPVETTDGRSNSS